MDKTDLTFKNAKAFTNYVMRFQWKSIVWLLHDGQYRLRKDGQLKMASPFEYMLLCKKVFTKRKKKKNLEEQAVKKLLV